ncbi:SurA N-terminal domain-containing protein [Streptomyces sp. NPDC050418]|uniref:SurA N-terminal domain-containing protein n=1 Tax=Streptomyces sp. NPDC050418 TaxID=3365612 RepID=UPI00378A3725
MHRRRRTALTVSAALLVAAPLLAACSNEAHPGAAAVVGDERISVAQLQERVGEVRTAQQEATADSAAYAQAVEKTGGLTRDTLHAMVFERVLHQAAVDAGVTVSRKEVQERRAWFLDRAGSPEALEMGLLQQYNIAPSRIDESLRSDLEGMKLYESLGADPQTDAGQQAFFKALSDASRTLDVDLNPRYGTWDMTKSGRTDVRTPWVREVTGSAEEA